MYEFLLFFEYKLTNKRFENNLWKVVSYIKNTGICKFNFVGFFISDLDI